MAEGKGWDDVDCVQHLVSLLCDRVQVVRELSASLDDVDAEQIAVITRRLLTQLHKIVEESTSAKKFVHKKFSRVW